MDGQKRYAVVVDLYIYAETDAEAKEKAKQFTEDAQFLVDNTENKAEVISIHESEFGKIGKGREVK